MISHSEASRNILAFAESGRLVQQQWRGLDAEGREVACLLGAIHPSMQSPEDCNAELMPMWLVYDTFVLFDGIAPTEIVPIAIRYGELVSRWDKISDAGWQSILRKFLIYLVDQAIDAAEPINKDKEYWPQVKSACEQVKMAIASEDRAVRAAAEAAGAAKAAARDAAGDARVARAAAEAAGAAWAAAWTVAWAAAKAAPEVAAWADWAVAWASAEAAKAAARAAAKAAWADWAIAEAAEAARAAQAVACLQLFDCLLSQIDKELGISSIGRRC